MRNQGRKSPGGDSRKGSGAGRGPSSKPTRGGDSSRGKSDAKPSFRGKDDKPADKKFAGPRSKDFGKDKPFGDKKFSDKKGGKDFTKDKPFGDKKFTDKRGSDKPFGDKKFGDKRGKDFSSDKPFAAKRSSGRDGARPFGDKKFDGKREPSSFSRNKFAPEKPATRGKSSYKDFERGKSNKPKSDDFDFDNEPRRAFKQEDDWGFEDKKPAAKKSFDGNEKKSAKPNFDGAKKATSKYQIRKDNLGKDGAKKSVKKENSALVQTGIRLNKYIANSGMCSRRDADVMIQNGVVSVNGNMMDELGYRVQPGDVVKFDGRTIIPEKPVYLLLNKPKDYITTSEDPQGRRTVMALIEGACKERLFPVGRLDRNTTGLLLFTNDGEMADKLMHPRKHIKKIYMVELDKNIKSDDLKQLREGITLEDGPIKPDAVEYAEGAKLDKKVLGVEIHSGRNRIVRRMFEHFGYKVVKLDRVYLAGLTKKNLPRGHYRMLEPLEVNMLKML